MVMNQTIFKEDGKLASVTSVTVRHHIIDNHKHPQYRRKIYKQQTTITMLTNIPKFCLVLFK